MFQYAIARRLARAINGRLILLLDNEFSNANSRPFRLKYFNIAGSLVRDEVVGPGDRNTPRMRARLADRIAWIARRIRPFPLIHERLLSDFESKPGPSINGAPSETLFMPELLHWRGALSLKGFWQDERYFADIGDVIRQDFILKDPLDERNRAAVARIKSGPSAFIHVRRGDYLQPQHIDRYGVCGAEYYSNAVALLKQQVGGDLKFFVFSDDPAWVREQKIGGAGAEIIDWNGATPERDIALMRSCNHAIIANSSFGWWGAWLGDVPGRIVIAPRIWFKAVPYHQMIVPQRWLRL